MKKLDSCYHFHSCLLLEVDNNFYHWPINVNWNYQWDKLTHM
ncbi:hypothetical protein ACJIZ3_019476 [Penstemon smallii]|uniref:Uncharacterized protein n=1 Tax=Penstemon smallii TaxID=265156 RepID=A0ABD3T1A1_9LAMI